MNLIDKDNVKIELYSLHYFYKLGSSFFPFFIWRSPISFLKCIENKSKTHVKMNYLLFVASNFFSSFINSFTV